RGRDARIPLALTPDEITALDAEHVWHPYGGFPATTEPLVVAAEGGANVLPVFPGARPLGAPATADVPAVVLPQIFAHRLSLAGC
ncbi:hypothetical protein, partial [Nocardia abscessus]|uniref:hypothetical protein n=1 Tax=Nocardia abscessus TaxID=120957 RepID=UPI0024550470